MSLFLAWALSCGSGPSLLLPPRHDTSVSSSRFTVERDRVNLTFTLSLEDLSAVVDLSGEGEGHLRPERYEALLPELARYFSKKLTVLSEGRTLSPELVRGVFPGREPIPLSSARTPLGVVLSFHAPGPVRTLTYRCDAFRECVADPKHLADFPDGQSFLLDRDRPQVVWRSGESWRSELGRFLGLGIMHILTGWDHLVFLVSLLLGAKTVRQVLTWVTAFNVAHSITLGLTALRVLSVPGAWVEPLIAASIVYVAVENLIVQESAGRWVLTFGFGLVHGLGFGGALLELNLENPVHALLGFNAGVEVGQLGVVAGLYPLLWVVRRKEAFYRRVVLGAGSVAAASLGGFWLLSRLF